MPKLNFETSAVLSDMLSELGLETIFSDQADFSGLSTEPTKVDSILQKTKLELNEEGTMGSCSHFHFDGSPYGYARGGRTCHKGGLP